MCTKILFGILIFFSFGVFSKRTFQPEVECFERQFLFGVLSLQLADREHFFLNFSKAEVECEFFRSSFFEVSLSSKNFQKRNFQKCI